MGMSTNQECFRAIVKRGFSQGMHQVVPLLPNSIIVEPEDGERQVVTDRGVEVGDVHHERRIRCDVSDPLAASCKTCSECDGYSPTGIVVRKNWTTARSKIDP